MYRWSDSLSTRPVVPNTITCQSCNAKNATRDLLHAFVTWKSTRLTDMLRLRLPPCIFYFVAVATSTSLHYKPAHFRILSVAASPDIGNGIIIFYCLHFWPDLTHGFDLIRLDFFLIRLIVFLFFIRLNCFLDLIRLAFNVFISDSSHKIWILIQSGFR